MQTHSEFAFPISTCDVKALAQKYSPRANVYQSMPIELFRACLLSLVRTFAETTIDQRPYQHLHSTFCSLNFWWFPVLPWSARNRSFVHVHVSGFWFASWWWLLCVRDRTMLLHFCSLYAHVQPLVDAAHFQSNGPFNQGAADTVSAFMCDEQTQLFLKRFSLDCSKHTGMLTSSPSTTAYTFAHASNIHLFISSTATPFQSSDCQSLSASARANPKPIFALYASIAGPISSCARQTFVDCVWQDIRQYTILTARLNDHMPETFDITENSFDVTIIQVLIVDFTDDFATVGPNRNRDSNFCLNISHFKGARLWIVYFTYETYEIWERRHISSDRKSKRGRMTSE